MKWKNSLKLCTEAFETNELNVNEIEWTVSILFREIIPSLIDQVETIWTFDFKDIQRFDSHVVSVAIVIKPK